MILSVDSDVKELGILYAVHLIVFKWYKVHFVVQQDTYNPRFHL